MRVFLKSIIWCSYFLGLSFGGASYGFEETDFGLWLNPYSTDRPSDTEKLQWPSEVQEIVEVLQTHIGVVAQNSLEAQKYQWQVRIYAAKDPGAFVLNGNKNGTVREIHISTALFDIFDSIDELMFVICHEMTHSIEGHDTQTSSFKNFFSSQANEVLADKGGLDLIKGIYDINSAFMALKKLSAALTPSHSVETPDLQSQLQAAVEAASMEHHDIGIRLTLLLMYSRYIKETTQGVDKLAARPLPSPFFTVHEQYSVDDFPAEFISDVIAAVENDLKNPEFANREIFTEFWSQSKSVILAEEIINLVLSSDSSTENKVSALINLFFSDPHIKHRAAVYQNIDQALERLPPDVVETLEKLFESVRSPLERTLNGTTNSSGISTEKIAVQLHQNGFLSNFFANIYDSNNHWKEFFDESVFQTKKLHASFGYADFPMAKSVDSELMARVARKYIMQFLALTEEDLAQWPTSLGDRSGLIAIHSMVSEYLEYPFVYNAVGMENIARLKEKLESHLQNRAMISTENLKSAQQASNEDILGFFIVSTYLLSVNGMKDTEYDHFLGFISQDENFEALKKFSSVAKQFVLGTTLINAIENLINRRTSNPHQFWKILNFLVSSLSEDLYARWVESSDQTLELTIEKDLWLVEIFDLMENPQNYLAVDLQTQLPKVKDKVNHINKMLSLMEKAGAFEDESSDFFETLKLRRHLREQAQVVQEKTGRWIHADYLHYQVSLSIGHLEKLETSQAYVFLVRVLMPALPNYYFLKSKDLSDIRPIIKEHFNTVSPESAYIELSRESTFRLLSIQEHAELFAENIHILVDKGIDLNQIWRQLSQTLDLDEKKRTFAEELRNKLSEKMQLQPLEVNQSLPLNENSISEIIENQTHQIRGWSALNRIIGIQSFDSQMQAIDYFMGRSSILPRFIVELHEKDPVLQLESQAHELRIYFDRASKLDRLAFISSIYHASNSQMALIENREKLFSHLLENVAPEKKKVATLITKAMMTAEGQEASLMLSGVLAEKSTDEKLSESDIIKSVLEFYGVPGQKFAQYLAFTGEFSSYQDALEDFQDQVPTPSYFSILNYIATDYADNMKLSEMKFIGVKGAGTVNLALEYIYLPTGEHRVLNLPRQYIETKTLGDFVRFKKFVDAVIELSDDDPDLDLEYLGGLTSIIEDSVNLEFDREQVYERQNDAISTYNSHQLGGWKLQTVMSYGKDLDAIHLQLGRGVTGKELARQNPEIYEEVMSLVFDFQKKMLFQKVEDGGSFRISNPDIHDGQFLIDPSTREIFIIDFGQAVRIKEWHRQFGLDIVSLILGLKKVSSAFEVLSIWSERIAPQSHYTKQEIEQALGGSSPMDRFVKLVSLLRLRGFNIPIETVNWVLEFNRVRALGERIGKSLTLNFGPNLIFREMRSWIGHVDRFSQFDGDISPGSNFGAFAEP